MDCEHETSRPRFFRDYLFAICFDLCLVDTIEVGVSNVSCAISVVQQELERSELVEIEGTMIAVL
jgi:hypothetical protein